MPRPYFQTEGLACFAHRGGAACWPENTLTAFVGGLAAGCPWIETDVHLTRDGHVVCFHDPTLERTTDGQGPVSARSLAELRRLDAGYNFSMDGRSFPFRGQGITIPTLAEVAALDPAARINLEVKPPPGPTGMVEPLLQTIRELGIEDRVLVASEDVRNLQAFRRAARGAIATSAGKREIVGFLLAARTGSTNLLRIEYDALQVPSSHYGVEVVNADFVRAAHKRGLQVHVWTIDDAEQMRALIELGVDGVMTDYPARLVQIAHEFGLLPDVGLASHSAPASPRISV